MVGFVNPMIKRHVVLTSGRSGSNHLVAALNQHSDLCNFGEVLGAWTLPARLWSPLTRLGASQAALLETIYTSRGVYYAAHGYLTSRANAMAGRLIFGGEVGSTVWV